MKKTTHNNFIVLLDDNVAHGQNSEIENPTKQILVLPGVGLVVEKTLSKLSKTTESEIYHLFKIKDTLTKIGTWNCLWLRTRMVNSASWGHLFQRINYDGVVLTILVHLTKATLLLMKLRLKKLLII